MIFPTFSLLQTTSLFSATCSGKYRSCPNSGTIRAPRSPRSGLAEGGLYTQSSGWDRGGVGVGACPKARHLGRVPI